MCLLTGNLITSKTTNVLKSIQAILEKRRLWLVNRVRLTCEQPKYTNCQSFSICIVYVKDCRCETWQETKKHGKRYTKQCVYDIFNNQKSCC